MFRFIFYIVLITLVCLTVYYALFWFNADKSGEAGFAIITGCLIPIIIFVKSWISKKTESQNEEGEQESFKININRKNIRCYKQDVDYAIQLNLELYTYEKISITDIQLTCKEPMGYSNKYRDLTNLPKLIEIDQDLLTEDIDSIESIIESTEKLREFPIVIEPSEHLLFTIAGYVPGERIPDGWEGLSLRGWKLVIEYNDNKKYNLEITLETHKNTLKVPSEYRIVGFDNV